MFFLTKTGSYFYSIGGHTYFKCQPKYGSMVPVISVEIGDFPPENDGLDDDDEI